MQPNIRKLTGLLLFFLSIQARAQKNIDGLIHAEKSFAAYSVANNAKDAFLKFLDSAGIVFEKGQPVNGIEAWNKKQVQPGILNWHPQFAEIAASGDFGYTTGPWTFQPKSIADSVVARGQYSTVWAMTKNGEWKFLVDLGVSLLPSTDTSEAQKITAEKIATPALDLLSMVKAEEAFIKAFQKNPQSAYTQFLSPYSILNRNKYLPATTPPQQSAIIAATPAEISFAINKSMIANSGDLGYVYGSTRLNEKQENYLRIWRREKDGWKLALEVLRY